MMYEVNFFGDKSELTQDPDGPVKKITKTRFCCGEVVCLRWLLKFC